MVDVIVDDSFYSFLANVDDSVSVKATDGEILFYQSSDTLKVMYKTSYQGDSKLLFRIGKKVLKIAAKYGRFIFYDGKDDCVLVGIDGHGSQFMEAKIKLKSEFESTFADAFLFYEQPTSIFSVSAILKNVPSGSMKCKDGIVSICHANKCFFEISNAPDYILSTKNIKKLSSKCWKVKNFIVSGDEHNRIAIAQTCRDDMIVDVKEILQAPVGFRCKFDPTEVKDILDVYKVNVVKLDTLLNTFNLELEDDTILKITAGVKDVEVIQQMKTVEFTIPKEVIMFAATCTDLEFLVTQYNFIVMGKHGTKQVGCIFK